MEQCPTTKRKHIQGYIEFNSPVAGGQKSKWVSEWIPGAHVEPKTTFSTREEAEHYCRKPCSAECSQKHCVEARKKNNGRIDWQNTQPTEIGTQEDTADKKKRITQGSRTDIAKAIQQIKDGVTVADIIEEQPTLTYHVRALERTHNIIKFKPKHRDVKVILLWGQSRTGKSYTARQQDHPIFNKSDGDWWDGYNGEKTIILDDYYGTLKYQELLKVLDPYPYQVPVKGGFLWAQYETIYITSNTSPHLWYKHGYTEALHNRLHQVLHYSKDKDGKVTITDDKPRLATLVKVEENELQRGESEQQETIEEYNQRIKDESYLKWLREERIKLQLENQELKNRLTPPMPKPEKDRVTEEEHDNDKKHSRYIKTITRAG